MKFTKLKKNENGFTGQDILIAIFMVTLFLSLLSGIFINLSKTSKEIRYTADITETFTKVAERVDKLTYDEVVDKPESSENIGDLISLDGITLDENINFKYYITRSDDGERATQDISVIGQYTIADKTNQLEIKLKKVSMMEITPENPEEPQIGGNTYMELTYPFNKPTTQSTYKRIKHVWVLNGSSITGYWVDASENDPNWYSVEEGTFPVYISSSVNPKTQYSYYPYSSFSYYDLTKKNTYIYFWVPRLCGTKTNWAFAHETSNNAIEPLATGGYKVGELKEQYKDGNNNVFGSQRGIMVEYYPRNKEFTSNNFNYLPSEIRSLLQSIKYF